MIKKLIFALYAVLVIGALFAIPKLTRGVPAADNTTISVDVQSISEITLYPSTITWTGVGPGHAGGQVNLDIVNTGSKNVSQIYAYVSTLNNETSRPYGTDDASKYAATGVIVLKNETDSNIYFAGRLEWNWTEDISSADLSNVGGTNGPCDGGPGNCSWGWFRNTSYEYVWAVSNGTNGLCNNTGTQFGIEDDADDGTTSTRTPITTNINRDGGDSDYSYFSVNRATSPLYGSCVAVSTDCQKIYIYKYDKRTSPNFNSCNNVRYVHNNTLTPRETHTLTLDAYVPYGTPYGNLATGAIYVVAAASQ